MMAAPNGLVHQPFIGVSPRLVRSTLKDIVGRSPKPQKGLTSYAVPYAVTVTTTVSVSPSQVAVMVLEPAAMALTRPVAETVALAAAEVA